MDSDRKIKVSFNSPVVLWFSILCLVALILGIVTNGVSTTAVFSVYRSSLSSPLTYIRFFGHICGHANWEHFIGNMTMLLVIGPLLEEKYGSLNILFVIIATALVTGIVNFIFFPHVQLMGAMLTSAVLMPKDLILQHMREFGLSEKMRMVNRVFAPKQYEVFSQIADKMGVSKTALAIRMKQLGLVERNDLNNPYSLVDIFCDD